MLDDLSKGQREAVAHILDRASELWPGTDRTALALDLAALNRTAPVDFVGLWVCGRRDFARDIRGIYRHLDRRTDTLQRGFRMKFAKNKEQR